MNLRAFGFTATQSAVFAALLDAGTATGYRISRVTGIARANVYHALDGLVARGIASCSGGRPAKYTAASPPSVLSSLVTEAERNLDALARDLGTASKPVSSLEERIGRDIRAVDDPAVLVHAAADAVRSASSEVLSVVGPWAPELASALTEARSRGVTWKVVALGAPGPEGALLRAVPEPELVAYWGGLPLAVLADRATAVCGTLHGGRCSGVLTTRPGLVPFLRHLLRREVALAAAPRVS